MMDLGWVGLKNVRRYMLITNNMSNYYIIRELQLIKKILLYKKKRC